MATNNVLLAGRLAVVTGGGSGIGRAICSIFAREGAKVAVVDLNKKSAEETLSLLPASTSDYRAYGTNVAISSEVTAMVSQVHEDFGEVPTVAVNAAGITKDNFLLKMDEQSFDDVINVNLKGTFLVNQAIGKVMSKASLPDCSIINIASIVGKCGNIGQTNYSASKAGVIGLTKTAAKELSRFNIRVNAVLPGFIDTPMTAKVPENVKQMIEMMIPVKRMGTPEEIAEVCAFLASTRSSYITGAAIEVTGGLNF
ncbi:3-oxoacyl-[acyl-carrier-protein] reductase fabg [Plakobranchus ocellatus]|uniref:(3R)-3-hydroxyacyl-CoA dehydrogenase n=1 Tax=Plakobranchus ocellatus TaxID=259542 RepID=A0AAV4D7D4_9GAST|nr:3-oxoacyl-[acyl-carrier-protein] reductase fabg [Plakobranchus ocellatus]